MPSSEDFFFSSWNPLWMMFTQHDAYYDCLCVVYPSTSSSSISICIYISKESSTLMYIFPTFFSRFHQNDSILLLINVHIHEKCAGGQEEGWRRWMRLLSAENVSTVLKMMSFLPLHAVLFMPIFFYLHKKFYILFPATLFSMQICIVATSTRLNHSFHGFFFLYLSSYSLKS